MEHVTLMDVDLVSVEHFQDVSNTGEHSDSSNLGVEFTPEMLASWTSWIDQINVPVSEPVKSTANLVGFPVFRNAIEFGASLATEPETKVPERTHVPLPETKSVTERTHLPLPETLPTSEATPTDLPPPLQVSAAATFTVEFDTFYFVDPFSNPRVSHYLAERAIANRLGPYEFTLRDRSSNTVLNVFCPSELVALWCNRKSRSYHFTAKEVMPALNAICEHYGVPCVRLDQSLNTVARIKKVNRKNLQDEKNHQVELGERCLECKDCHRNREMRTMPYGKFLTQKFYAHYITDNAKHFVNGHIGDVPAFHLRLPAPPRYRTGRAGIHYNGQAIEFLPFINLRPILTALFAYLIEHSAAFQTLTLANASQWANAVFGIAQHLSKLNQKRGTPPLDMNLNK